MSVILVDLADDNHGLQINWWNWRPILAFLRRAELVTQEQFELLGMNACGGQLTRDEAMRAATYLRCEIIPRMQDGQRMHANGDVSAIPEEPQLIEELSSHELYAAAKSCVEAFASFCEASQGFKVY